MVPRWKVQELTSDKSPTQELEQLDLFPTCVVTRTQARTQTHSDENPQGDVPTCSFSSDVMTPKQLVKSQHVDPTLSKLHHEAVSEKDIEKKLFITGMEF